MCPVHEHPTRPAEHGCRVRVTAAAMIATLIKTLNEDRLEDKLKAYTVPSLLIIDLCGAPGYVEFVSGSSDRVLDLEIAASHN